MGRPSTGRFRCGLEHHLPKSHPGDNATMWSRGAPNAWFSIDLKYVELCPTHYCCRGDAGGGENHPRTWKLQGSCDGTSWTTLREHKHDNTVQMHTVGSFPLTANGQFYRFFRVQNCGAPNHLCCSGIEFYGTLRPVSSIPFAQVVSSPDKKKVF